MPKPRKNECIRCAHFAWRIACRGGVWYADGRSNTPDAGRHSLGTSDRDEALRLLSQLDQVRAETLGLVPRSLSLNAPTLPLPLEDGRKLYETHVSRPRVTGGVRKSTQKRYRAVFDKFVPFATSHGITCWNGVTTTLLNEYAADLERKDYAYKTQHNELTTLKQAIRWLIQAGHLHGAKPIELKLRKAESERPYCYRPDEVRSMIEHCRAKPTLQWMADLITALACTGLRISELASLRWSDLNLAAGRLNLTDETGRPRHAGRGRRELKSGRSRSFPIHPDLRTAIDRLPRSDAYVFHGPRGGRINPDTIRNVLIREVITPLREQFAKQEDEKGFEDGRVHSFRHYFCSTCANSGVPERMVMEWLGHQDSEMVRIYYHLHDDEARRRMAALDFLGGAGGRSASQTG
jgi:integrase